MQLQNSFKFAASLVWDAFGEEQSSLEPSNFLFSNTPMSESFLLDKGHEISFYRNFSSDNKSLAFQKYNFWLSKS